MLLLIDSEASIGEIASVLNIYKIKRVPVFEKNQMVGIISRGDLVRP